MRSATWSGVADSKGYITDKAIDFYGNLAAGGVGLIITGFQYVMPNGVSLPYQMGNYSNDLLPGMTRLTGVVHSQGGKVVAQLAHAGARASEALFFEKAELWSASSLRDPWTGNRPKEMTTGEIAQLVEAYQAAAIRAKRAGFDGVQLHGAHGLGINQFLSGATNQRTDEYGGDIRRRYRFLGELLEAVRGAVGQDYPVFIKLSGHDYFDGGLVPEESLYIARRLEEDGVDCIEISGGNRASAGGNIHARVNIRSMKDEAYFAQLGGWFKSSVRVPIVTVGGIRSLTVVSAILTAGQADYVALCRPLIREPHLIDRWKSGDSRKASCISCNGCFETAAEGHGVYCRVEKKLQKSGKAERRSSGGDAT